MRSNVCVNCSTEMRVKKNDVLAVLMDNEDRCDVVNAADLWQCPSCKRETLSGFSIKRLAIGHEACEALLVTAPPETIFRYYRKPT